MLMRKAKGMPELVDGPPHNAFFAGVAKPREGVTQPVSVQASGIKV
jgi:hypothetical protein